MAVAISNDGALAIPLSEDEVRQVIGRVLDLEGVERDVDVSVSIVDDEAMRALNAEWRGIDAPTDVLSFECDSPFDGSVPAGEPVELGDIVLAPDVIAAQAPGFGFTAAREFRLMLVHGMLHLLGYDHIEPDDARRMEGRELEVLRSLAVSRGDDPDLELVGPTTSHEED